MPVAVDDRERARLLVDTLRARWRTAVGVALAFTLITAIYAASKHKTYTSTTEVLVNPVPGTPFDVEDKPTRFTKLSTEAQVAASDDVAKLALAELPEATARHATVKSLIGSVAVTVKPETQVLDISFRGRTPSRARDGAATFAKAYLDFRSTLAAQQRSRAIAAIDKNITAVNRRRSSLERELAGAIPDSPSALAIDDELNLNAALLADDQAKRAGLVKTKASPGKVLSPADLPTSPSSRSPLLLIIVGAFIGIILGFITAVARERSQGNIRDAQLLPDDVPLLVSVPPAESTEPVIVTASASAAAESYRRLATTLRGMLSPGSVVVVAPFAPHRELAPPVAVDLAYAVARDGRSVTLVMTAPSASALGALPALGDLPGLSEALTEGRDPTALRIPVGTALHVLPPGRAPARSGELFASARMRAIVDELANAADLVIIDSPPMSDPDGQALSIVSDGVVLTCLLGVSTRRQLLAALGDANHVRADVLGVVAVTDATATTDGDRRTAPPAAAAGRAGASNVRAGR